MFQNDFPANEIHWLNTPELRDPYLIVGFHGWSNAGSVSSDTLAFFKTSFEPELIGYLNEEMFQHLTADRPLAIIEDGLIQRIDPCYSEIYCWQAPEGQHDLVFILGKEPHIFWANYCSILFKIVDKLDIKKVFTIGGVQDTVSHAGQPLVTVVATTAIEVAEITKLGHNIRPAKYHGPVSIHSRIVECALKIGLPAISLWAHVPAYIQKSPRAVAKIISILNKSAGTFCATDTLIHKSLELERRINEAIAKDPELRQFVETIEGKGKPKPVPATRDKVIRIDFLKKDTTKHPES